MHTDYYDTMVGVYMYYYMHRMVNSARATRDHIRYIYILYIGIKDDDIGILCVFHGSFGSRSQQQWRQSIVFIISKRNDIMTVPGQLARARARRLMSRI